MVDNTVGDIDIRLELNLERLDIKQNVGNLKLDSHIVSNVFDFKNTTGDIDISINQDSSFILDSKYSIG